jgi:hypothetical protein
MSNDTTRQSVLFEEVANRPVVVRFDQDHSSSDAKIKWTKINKSIGQALTQGVFEVAAWAVRPDDPKTQRSQLFQIRK